MHEMTKTELEEILLVLLESEGFGLYEVDSKEEYKPDFIAIYEEEEEDSQDDALPQIAVQVEDCQTIKNEETKKKALAIAEHCRVSGEGFVIVVPENCEQEAREILRELKIEDVAELLSVRGDFEQE